MFSNKKDNNKEAKSTTNMHGTHNILGKGTEIEGKVTAKSDVRIDGTIVGHLTCSAKVIIGVQGKVKGEISCENAIIEGAFEGDIRVKGLLTLQETAVVTGNVITNKLSITAGAKFNGTCSMGSNAKKVSNPNGQANRKTAATRNFKPKAAAENGNMAQLEKEAS